MGHVVGAFLGLLLVLHSCAANYTDPGFRVAFTSKALAYLTDVGVPILKQELSTLSIPDQSGKADVKIGKIKYQLKNIHLADFEIGSSSLTTSPGQGLTFTATDISIAVSADWSYKIWFAKDHGSIQATGGGISLSVSILLGANDRGQPNVTTTGCSFNVGHLSVKLSGGASWLYNLFDGIFEDQIKSALDDKICDLARDGINKAANSALGSLPVVIKIDDISELSYALIRQPNFTSWFVMTYHKGEFLSVNQPTGNVPFSPSPLPPMPPASESECRMVYLWATDYVANTAGLVYTRAGYLQYNITPDTVSSLKSFFKLDTSTFSLVVPELYRKYPEKNMSIGIRVTDKPPMVHINPEGVNLAIPIAVDFYVILNDTSPMMFTLGVMASVDANVSLVDDSKANQLLVMANATNLSAKLSVMNSNIGDIKLDKFQGLFDILSNSVLLPQINNFANKGFPIPNAEGLQFIKPSLTLGKGYVVIATDISYGL